VDVIRTGSSRVTSCLRSLKGGLIVSCQTDEGTPLNRPQITAAVVQAAVQGGAVGVRVRGVEDIQASKAAVSVPVIGLTKRHFSHSPVYITPTWEDVEACIAVGADIVALDATDRPRPDGLDLAEVISRARATADVVLMADVSQLHEAEEAAALGVDLVATTLAGYSDASPPTSGPDFHLLSALVEHVDVPVVAEGRITTPEQAAEALRLGAWAVCVGKAITAPQFITGRFVEAMQTTERGAP
jgi:N-acylglucosamine-6-phosphate 2-epimerase